MSPRPFTPDSNSDRQPLVTDDVNAPKAFESPIPGLVLWRLPVHKDNRGWFKENWQREKMVAAGLPDFGPVQHNISFNTAVGTTRGIHAEPWDKLVSVATGSVFGAWVDLRDGPTFGSTFTAVLDATRAVFVPRGVGNAFQTLERDTAYTYLVNDHWSPEAEYASLHLQDESVGIAWPIPMEHAELSAKDTNHPRLENVKPMPRRKTLVLGAEGQLGRALRAIYGDALNLEFAARSEIDLTSTNLEVARRWADYDTIINAAAYTSVDMAETPEGRVAAWATNVAGVAVLARIASRYRITLVNVSSDYVFDGTLGRPYLEDDLVAPLGVYGQTKAAGDQIVATVPHHYIVRTSWVIGDGRNFVRTMVSLAQRGANPSVIDDQRGRLTFAFDLARAIRHLLDTGAAYGVYNVTGAGSVMSWSDIAHRVFELTGHDPNRIKSVSTSEYVAKGAGPSATRPRNSALDLSKAASVGFRPSEVDAQLAAYVSTIARKIR